MLCSFDFFCCRFSKEGLWHSHSPACPYHPRGRNIYVHRKHQRFCASKVCTHARTQPGHAVGIHLVDVPRGRIFFLRQ